MLRKSSYGLVFDKDNLFMEYSLKKQNNYIEQILKLRLSGVEIYVDGCECSIYEIKEMLSVCERGTCYMPDYIEDKSTGRIKEIRFDKINLIE
jgi:hypothetical protein